MKKTLLIIITAFALVVSCKQKEVVGPAGANGTNGTNGTDGTDGNANVKTFLYTTKTSDWTPNFTENPNSWTCIIKNVSNVNKSVLDSGSVEVYWSGGNISTPTKWTALPATNGKSSVFVYSYQLNQVELTWSSFDGSAIINPEVKNIKIVTSTSTK